MTNLESIIKTARGIDKADLVLADINIVNVFTNEIYKADIAIKDGFIAGIGNYKGLGKRELNLSGKYASPGLIDAHNHIECSMVTPSLYSQAVLPRGTTAIVTDPHEIANVCGIDGISYMLKDSTDMPIDFYFMVPSCVPATPFETSGARIDAKDMKKLLGNENIIGLAEMMNYPGVLNCEPVVIDKLNLFNKYNIDGHAPNLSGKDLCAYRAAGIKTDHECTTQEELIEKARVGMYVAVREGSAAKNLECLLKGLDKKYLKQCIFCTDDMHIEDILTTGNIDNCIRKAIAINIDPVDAISMATLNTAQCYGLKNRGAIAPGFMADIAIFDNLKDFNIEMVFKSGKLVAKDNKCIDKYRSPILDPKVRNTIHIKKLSAQNLQVKLKNDIAKVIHVIPKSIVTQCLEKKVSTNNGEFRYDEDKDIVKIVVVERHKMTGNVAVGLLENFGIKNGAIAMSISHDSHNIVATGTNDKDILNAINEIARFEGGIAISSNQKTIASLPLPIAGLMSDEGLKEVSDELHALHNIAHNYLKIPKDISPFTTLSFMSLSVIPELRITDKGLFDVNKFVFTDIMPRL